LGCANGCAYQRQQRFCFERLPGDDLMNFRFGRKVFEQFLTTYFWSKFYLKPKLKHVDICTYLHTHVDICTYIPM
jgi:hypothetical protein